MNDQIRENDNADRQDEAEEFKIDPENNGPSQDDVLQPKISDAQKCTQTTGDTTSTKDDATKRDVRNCTSNKTKYNRLKTIKPKKDDIIGYSIDNVGPINHQIEKHSQEDLDPNPDTSGDVELIVSQMISYHRKPHDTATCHIQNKNFCMRPACLLLVYKRTLWTITDEAKTTDDATNNDDSTTRKPTTEH